MALSPRLDLRQSQSLVMTPQLQQAIKMLQLNNLELAEFVEQEIERNPLLQHEDDAERPEASSIDAADSAPQASDEGLGVAHEESPLADSDTANLWDTDAAEAGSAAGRADDPWEPSPGTLAGGGDAHTAGGGEDEFERTIERTLTLRDRLAAQLGLATSDAAERLIGHRLIDALDDAGYLTAELADIADDLGAPLEQVARVLALVQQFEPAGLFARSLGECLALQLKERNRLDPAMQALLDNLDRLAKRDFPYLLRICGVDREDLAEMIAEIRALDPKPGLNHAIAPVEPVVPDILLRVAPDGGWLIELNSATLPRVLVDSAYYAAIRRQATSKEDRQFVSGCFQTANWLVKALHQRATTILKVATEIVRQQDGFFRHGVSHLKPLVLRDIATAVEMHESTVSRVTANKFIATPLGLFELKYFFTSALATSGGGDAVSSEAVRQRIRQLIEVEKAAGALSDDRLAEVLQGEGIDVARRTVAKYRESLGIGSSVERRREKSKVL